MKKQMRRLMRTLLTALTVLVVWSAMTLTVQAYPGEVSADNVNVRKSATVGSDSLGTLRQGTAIDIEGEETDANGQVWYRITYNGQTGYIRGDLVEAEDGGNVDPATTADDPAQGASTTPAAGARTGTVSTNTPANVRSGPGRNFALADFSPIPTDAVVEVTGEETDTNGELWYKIVYEGQEGYIIETLLNVTEAPPTTPAEQPAETPVETPVTVDPAADNPAGMMGQQYTVAYDMDDTGETVPYLVDNNNGSQRWRVQVLLESYEDSVRLEGIERTNTVLKIVSVILGIITLVAVILLLLLGMRFRRYTEDDYEDDNGYGNAYDRGGYDDEDDEEEDEDEEPQGRAKRGGGFFSRFKRGGREDDFDDEDDEDYDDEDDYEEEPRAIRRVYQPERDYDDRGRGREVVTPTRASRRPRNFMEDDEADDYEYSFLDDDR